ncbi:SIR2 family NAD-dependent protein deacylase [Anaerosphaera multitolerans]|uniref:protein acetyllysine N-acetyltransferase n=1 Tax=Anaerosphaera multitolerans TaxID=2487351 RepID=A0A437S7I0_9FIRM|nr:Sir2 family NAD-dependent protein deacetylase [Anaerosphaera multitolerans]RVU54904.1 NAD-dependent deacetylase [Anaerosphaera multitolerans]
MIKNYNEKIEVAAKLIISSKKSFALTGAGISTESGIPDFRSETGYYQKMDPISALSRDVLLKNPKRFYSEGYKILEDLNDKRPNMGHIALAELERLKLLSGVITQNIDNLHAKAGSERMYEVHGETRGIHCINCGKSYDFSVMKAKVEKNEIPPKCDNCGGTLRPNVVMFGDMMPDDFQRAVMELETTELLIVVGSSLTVSPVNFLPRYVDRLIIINSTPTPEDRNADLVFHEQAGDTLKDIVTEVKNINGI